MGEAEDDRPPGCLIRLPFMALGMGILAMMGETVVDSPWQLLTLSGRAVMLGGAVVLGFFVVGGAVV